MGPTQPCALARPGGTQPPHRRYEADPPIGDRTRNATGLSLLHCPRRGDPCRMRTVARASLRLTSRTRVQQAAAAIESRLPAGALRTQRIRGPNRRGLFYPFGIPASAPPIEALFHNGHGHSSSAAPAAQVAMRAAVASAVPPKTPPAINRVGAATAAVPSWLDTSRHCLIHREAPLERAASSTGTTSDPQRPGRTGGPVQERRSQPHNGAARLPEVGRTPRPPARGARGLAWFASSVCR